ncbi:hypothetical protein [Nocardia carnea]|uniref:hypothetical protein n=1 Tax=Nocardia carnea TaxID=37328 RepID=UPI002454EA0C|nr:hypothetical protein [Nocardia carnea]
MSEGQPHWLSTSQDHQVIDLPKAPVISYPFGKQEQPEYDAGTGVSTEDPRVIHGRISPSPRMNIPVDEPDGRDASVPEKRSSGRGHTGGLDHVSPPIAAIGNDAERTLEPIPQALALAQVRKDILAGDSAIAPASSGKLVAERFSVGWVVYSPAIGEQSTTTIYYVTDDGDLERSSSVSDPSAYLESVEQRFCQRQALLG